MEWFAARAAQWPVEERPSVAVVSWVIVCLCLLLMAVYRALRMLLQRERPAMEAADMAEMLKQNLAPSLARAQVQAWVDAMSPISGTVDEAMARMHSRLEEVAAQILETMGVQVKNLGDQNLLELRAQLADLAETMTEISKIGQMLGPFQDLLESLKGQVRESWKFDAEKLEENFKNILGKLNSIGGLTSTSVKKLDETLAALERLGPG